MVSIYTIALVLGVLGLIVIILGGALAQSVGRPHLDPGERIGTAGKMIVGALVGFGMGGMSAEFSPLDLAWQLSFLLAVVASGLAAWWVRHSVAGG